ncbi:MAG TPA: hypothetical protein VGM64_04210 [Lacunisphaera sp.]|jgi:hypothetical protein
MPLSPSTARLGQSFSGKSAPVLLAVLIALLYGGSYLSWYLGTPLGQVPVLDEQENITLATSIYHGTLAAEPFYRSPGYALGLACFRWIGIPASSLFPAALAFGVLLHALNAALGAQIAGRLFGRNAAFFAGLLIALNPVLVYFSTQALDAVPSLTLFLLGLNRLIKPRGVSVASSDWIGASLFWGAATIVRPNFLAVWLLLPVLAGIISAAQNRRRHVCAALAGLILFAALGCWQWSVAGTAGFLPWQGAYNLWAANQPGSNGRFYVQKSILPVELARQNPARIESILYYQQATGRTDANIPAMNSYWRGRFVSEVTTHPLAWLHLLSRKAYALCNDWEQYNNKTYAFHRERSPWLRWNPLSWGIFFVLGIAGLAQLAMADRPRALLVTLIGVVYSLSVLLFYVSDRFRLPLVALNTVLAAGALAAPAFWRNRPRHRQWLLGVGILLAGTLTFSRFDGVDSTATFVQDHALLARAADTVGQDRTAWIEARAALALQPGHPDAMRIAIAAYFNELLNGTARPTDETQWLEISRHFLAATSSGGSTSDLRIVAALALWRSGEHDAARTFWRGELPNPGAVSALLLSGDEGESRNAFAHFDANAWRQPLVQLAAAQQGIAPPTGVARPFFANPQEMNETLFFPRPSK